MTQIDECKLRDIAQLKSGNTPSKADSSLWGGDINWVSASSMHSDVIYNSEIKLTEEGLKYSKTFPRNTIVILIRGSMLWNRIPICRLGEKAAINQDVKSIVVTSERLETDYLYFWLKAKEPKLKQAVIGTGIGAGKIETEFLYNLPIRIPNRTHQQRLINLFKAVDQKINLLTKKKEALETYKKGLMQKVFSKELRFKREDGTDYPDWRKLKIGNIATLSNGKDYKQLNKGKIPVYGTGGLITYVNEYLYNGESVGIGRKGTIDKPVFLNGKFWTVDTLFFTHSFSGVTPKFLFYVFQQINWKKYNEASGVPSLSKSTINSIEVNLPQHEEQEKITELFTKTDATQSLVLKQISSLESFKKGLLQQMFV